MAEPPEFQPLEELYSALQKLLELYRDTLPANVRDAFYDLLLAIAVNLGRDKPQA